MQKTGCAIVLCFAGCDDGAGNPYGGYDYDESSDSDPGCAIGYVETGAGGCVPEIRYEMSTSFSCSSCGGQAQGNELSEWEIVIVNCANGDLVRPEFGLYLMEEQYFSEVCELPRESYGFEGYTVAEESLVGTDCDPIRQGELCTATRTYPLPVAADGVYRWVLSVSHDHYAEEANRQNNIVCSSGTLSY